MAKSSFAKLSKILTNKTIGMKTRLRVRQCYVRPVLTYGCESWTLTKNDEIKINSFEMKCYRKMMRIPWTAKKRNEDIIKELNIKPNWLLQQVKKRKLCYFGHIKRHDTLEKHVLEAKLEGKRRRGRPTRRWTDDIRDWTERSAAEAGRVAQNSREDYRRITREATSKKETPR